MMVQGKKKAAAGPAQALRKRDPHVAFKTAESPVKHLPGVEIMPDVEIQPDTSNWLTRQQSAEFLGVSITTIANYERSKKLIPRHEYRKTRGFEQRVVVYDPKQLTPLRIGAGPVRERIVDPGELAAQCFELLDQGRTIREIVIAVRQTPAQVIALHESWLDSGGADLTITSLAKKRLEGVVDTFTDVAGLVTLVEGLAKKDELATEP